MHALQLDQSAWCCGGGCGLLPAPPLPFPVEAAGCCLHLPCSSYRHCSTQAGLFMPPPNCLQDDLPAAAVRRMIGPDAILGVSVKTVEEVRRFS